MSTDIKQKRTWSAIIHLFLFAIILIYFSPIELIWSLKDFSLGILAGFCIYILCFIIKMFYSRCIFKPKEIYNIFGINMRKDIKQHMPLLFYIPSTIGEELLLRSYIFNTCLLFFPISISIFINAVLFYLIHFDKRIVELAISAIIYCLLVFYTGNILTSIIAHVVYNLMAYFIYEKKDISNS